MDSPKPTITGVHDRLLEIARGRPIPFDRLEAALFGYSEEEWQEMVDAVNAVRMK